MRRKRRRIVVWGAGGHGKVVIDALLASGSHDVVGVIDDNSQKAGQELLGIPVLDFSDGLAAVISKWNVDCVSVAIGDNYARYGKFQEVRCLGLKPANVIHPSAHISPFVRMGEGITVLAGATINAGVVLEDNICVNTAASVDHDDYLEQSCHIQPNSTLTGTVRVEEFAYVGSGSVVAPNLTVHKYSYVGAGAVVVRDVPEGTIVIGVPAEIVGRQTRRPVYADMGAAVEGRREQIRGN
jgi:sugar O-acyltransferase (sialic acid O-acetyltransferase NeuD family)